MLLSLIKLEYWALWRIHWLRCHTFHSLTVLRILIRGVNKDCGGGVKFWNFFYPPPLLKNIMMYIKLLILIEFNLHFQIISGIYKLYQIKASFPTFQRSPCFISFIIVNNFTFTTKICKNIGIILLCYLLLLLKYITLNT